MTKTLGFQLDMEGSSSTIHQLAEVETTLQGVTQQLKELKKEGKLKENIEQFKQLRAEQIKLQQDGTKLRKEIREQRKEFEATKYPKDSLIGLRQEYRNLSKQIAQLDAQTLKSTHGQNLVNQAAAIDKQIKKTEYAIGNFRRNVGNYQDALRGVGGLVGGQLGIAGVGMGGGAGLAGLINPWIAVAGGAIKVIADLSKVSKEYETQLTNLKAVSGANADEIERLDRQAQNLGATTLFTASSVAGLQTELAKLGFTVQEIIDATPEIIKFSTALEVDAGRSAALAGAALRAFQMDASEMNRVVSTLAVSTTKSALDFSKLENALPTVAAVAKGFNFEIEDTVALLGQLADAGLDASTAGTATRNILLNLADANGQLAKRLGGSVSTFDELIDSLKELNSQGIDLNETLELTDKRSVTAFNLFLENAEKTRELKDAVTDATQELDKMAKMKEETAAGAAAKFKSAYDGLLLSIDSGNGTLSKARKGWLNFLETQFTGLRMINEGSMSWSQALTTPFKDFADLIDDIDRERKILNEFSDDMGNLVTRFDEAGNAIEDLQNKMPDEPLFQKLWLDQKVGDEKAIVNPLVKLNNEIKELKSQLDDPDLSGKEIQKLLNKIDQTQAKINNITGRGKSRIQKAAKEFIDGSLAYFNNEVKIARQALDNISLDDPEAFRKAKEQLDKAQADLDQAKQNLRNAEDIALEQDLENIERLKNERVLSILESGMTQENMTKSLRDLEDQTQLEILRLKIAYAKQGSKELEALEVQLAQKKVEIADKAGKDSADALQRQLQSELDNIDKALADDLLSLNLSARPQFENLQEELDTAVGIEQYEAVIQRKQDLEKELADEIKRLTLEAERERIQIKKSFADQGTLEYSELLKRESEIELQLVQMTEEQKDRIRKNFFEKQLQREEQIRELYENSIDLANEANRSLTKIALNRIDAERNAQLDALDEYTQRRIERAEGDEELISRIREEEERKREEIEREAFERSKRAAKAEAVVQGAIAAVRAFVSPGFPAAFGLLPFIAGQVALSVAEIASQTFALGGKVRRVDPDHIYSAPQKLPAGKITARPNVRPTPQGDNVFALVKPGEVILNQQQQAAAGGPDFFRRLGVPGFASGGRVEHAGAYNTGGLVSDLGFNPNEMPNALSNFTLSSQGRSGLSDGDIDQLASRVGNILAPMLFNAVKQGSKEGTNTGAFEALNEDKRLKERQNWSRLNSEF